MSGSHTARAALLCVGIAACLPEHPEADAAMHDADCYAQPCDADLGGDAPENGEDASEPEADAEVEDASTEDGGALDASAEDAGDMDAQLVDASDADASQDAQGPGTHDAATDHDAEGGPHDSGSDGAEPDATPPTFCPSMGPFTPRPLTAEVFQVPQAAAPWEGATRIDDIVVEGNVLLYTFGAPIVPMHPSTQAPLPTQDHCGVGLAEWDGSGWHEVFRTLYPTCNAVDLENDRAVVFVNAGDVYLIERTQDGGWTSRYLRLAAGVGDLDGDRLIYPSTQGDFLWNTPQVAVSRQIAGVWEVIQTIPMPTWYSSVTAHDGVLRLASSFYRWNGAEYIADEALTAIAPQSWSGASFAKGDCENDSAAAGVCADPEREGAENSGAVRVYGSAAGGNPEGIYFKASNPEAGDAFCKPTLRGEMLAVWAAGEDGASVGIDGDQSSNAAPDSGALYLFLRDPDGWHQHHYIKTGGIAVGSLSSQRIALVDRAQSRIHLYRFAEPPPPTFVYRRPCEGEDGAPLPAGHGCLLRAEPPQLCPPDPVNCWPPSGPDEHQTRRYVQRCSGTSLECDGPGGDSMTIPQPGCQPVVTFSCRCPCWHTTWDSCASGCGPNRAPDPEI